MTIFLKILFVSIIFLNLSAENDLLQNKQISIATFNIKNYGAQEQSQSFLKKRDETLSQFIKQQLNFIDIFVFQEIINVNRFTSEIISSKHYKCHSYDLENLNHQHVVICLKNTFAFVKYDFDENNLIEEVGLEFYRPALYGKITDDKKSILFNLIGVHLKATPDSQEVRMTQIKWIDSYLKLINNNKPIIIAGDFNTYEFQNESEKMLQILNEWRLEKVKNNHQKSYVSYKGKFSLFDHFFASKNLFSSESQSLGACEYPDNREYLENYRKYVSDHCPVINTIFLQ